MGSALSTRYTSSSSDTSSSSANNTPRESRVVVVAKRANSTPNLKSDLNASPTNFPSSTNNVVNNNTNNNYNTSPTSSMNNNVSPSMSQFKFPRHATTSNVARSSSFTRNLHGGTTAAALQNNTTSYANNSNNVNNNNFDTVSLASVQPSIITTSNIKLQAHESSMSLLRLSPGVARTPSPDNTSDALSSPKSIEQLVDNTHIFSTASNPSTISSIGNNQSSSPPILSSANTPTTTIMSAFGTASCTAANAPVNSPPVISSTSLPPIHSQPSSGFNNGTSPNNFNSSPNCASPTHFSFPSHSPTLVPIQTDNPLPSVDRVSTPNRYRHIQSNPFAAYNSNRRGSVSNPIVPVAIVENNNSGTNSIEITNSFSSLSQWGGINEEIILPETQKMNDYNKGLKKQVKSTINPEDLTRLEIGDNSDILIQMLLYNPIATVITDLDGNVIVMNEPFKVLFRVDDPENITNISIFIPKDYRKYHEKILKKYKKKNRPKIKRVTLGLTQYGDKIPISITVTTAELQTSGKPVYICFVKDLTSEFKLNTLDVMYQNVTGLSSIPIIGIDQDCRITLFNHAAEETWMISKAEVLENNVKILMPMATGKVHDKFVTEYIIGKREKSVIDKVKQVIGRRVGNGKEFPLEIKVAEVRHELNNKRSFVAFLRDLTAVMTAREFQLTLYPEKVVNMLESGERTIHHHHTCASVLFCDIVGFTEISRQMESNELVMILDEIISMFDNHLLSKFRIEKIKTMGDNYMCATGLDDSTDHANNIVEAAIEMQKLMHEFNERHAELRERFPDHCNDFGQVISVRVGVNSGDLVAGIVGNRKPVYDVFGDNVNLASRMESSGIESQVQITPKTYSLLKNELKQYFTIRRDNKVKGIGLMDTYITNLSTESFEMKSSRINYHHHHHSHQHSGIPNIGDVDEQSLTLTSSTFEDDIDGIEHSNL